MAVPISIIDIRSSTHEMSLQQELKDAISSKQPHFLSILLKCHGLLGTYNDAIKWLRQKEIVPRPKCILSLGSTLGSASRLEAATLLKRFTDALAPTQSHHINVFVVGLDGCKDGNRIWNAYNDSEGRNGRFRLNVLDHANKVLGYRAFQPEDWEVNGVWETSLGRHEQYLVPNRDVYVALKCPALEGGAVDGRAMDDGAVWFSRGQMVTVVNSHK